MVPRRNRVCNTALVKAFLSYIFSKKKRGLDYMTLFENELAMLIGTKHALLTSTGRKGLSLIIDYYSFPLGSEIILPAYTLKDLVFLIKEKGLNPVFIDISPLTYNIEASLIEEKINSNTVMIIVTHIFGMPCEIDKIAEAVKKYKIILVEDCAHAMGAAYKGKSVGSFGDASFFSLEVSKPINTFGGGVTVTNNDDLYDYMRRTTQHYSPPGKKLFIKMLTSIIEDIVINSFLFSVLAFIFYFKKTKVFITNFYLLFSRKVNIKDFSYTNFQAFLGLNQLNLLHSRNRRLMEAVIRMRDYFENQISHQVNLYGSDPAFYCNVIKTNLPAEEVRRKLLLRGIDCGIQDEITDNCVMHFNPGEVNSYPNTKDCYYTLLQIPMFDNIDERVIQGIAKTINKVLSE